MIAQLQRNVVFALLFLATTLAAVLVRAGHPAWACATFVAIAFGHAAILAIEFVLLSIVTRNMPALRPDLRSLLPAWGAESVQAIRVFGGRQPFLCHVHPDFLPSVPTGKPGVLLVHGLLCNRGFWNPWLACLRKASTACIAVNLEPIYGSIDDNVDTIESAVSRLTAATGCAPLLVGHSRGGLVLRAWLAKPGAPARVSHVITIGTPHGGTWLAQLALNQSAGEMRLGSAWLASLRRRESPAAATFFTCFYSRCDNIVFPADCATLPGADNREVRDSAHVQLAFEPIVFNEVTRWLQRGDAGRSPTFVSADQGDAAKGVDGDSVQ